MYRPLAVTPIIWPWAQFGGGQAMFCLTNSPLPIPLSSHVLAHGLAWQGVGLVPVNTISQVGNGIHRNGTERVKEPIQVS